MNNWIKLNNDGAWIWEELMVVLVFFMIMTLDGLRATT
jgi:hypothetical protein